MKEILFLFFGFSFINSSPIPCYSCGGGGARQQQLPAQYPEYARRRTINNYPQQQGYGMSPRGRQLDVEDMDYNGNMIGGPVADPIVVMKNIPNNPLSDPKKLNIDDIPLVPHNQIVYIKKPYLIVVDQKSAKNATKEGSTEAEEGSTASDGESTTGEEGASEGGEEAASEGGEETTAAAEGEGGESTSGGDASSEEASSEGESASSEASSEAGESTTPAA